tara:strand:- start:1683 stop:1958 length:276 start_codon:yes stop_codon:yes gene_type:complete
MAYYANVYELDRVYGGPEEGGWWFTTFTPKASRKFNTKLRARIVLESMLQERLNFKPEYGLYSVNYNGGVFSGHVEDKEAEFSPKGPIHYA